MARIVVDIPISLKLVPDAFVQRLSELPREHVTSLFPYTLKRLRELAEVGQTLWREQASRISGTEGRPLRLGTGPSDPMVRLNRTEYVNSILVEQGPTNEASFVIVSDDPQASIVEYGGMEIDLHAVLDYAPKARLSKAGQKYLRIPFRHATTEAGSQGQRFQAISKKWGSNVLTPAVHRAMQKKRPHLMTSSYVERGPNVKHGMVQRFLYTKGDRLKSQALHSLGIDPASLTGQKLVGLMRTGKKGHSQYLTIRTLSQANPEGWRIQAYEAQSIASKVAQSMRELATDWFDGTIAADAQSWLESVA